MRPAEIAAKAKLAVTELFADEKPYNLGLEELSATESGWNVTISFSRGWDTTSGSMALILKPPRVAKLVKLDKNGVLVEIKNAISFNS